MGGCAGRTKTKQSDVNQKPKSRNKDDYVQSKALTSIDENLPTTNDSIVKNIEANGNDSDVPATANPFDEANKAISQIFSSRVISVSNTEFELELAKLIYGNPDQDYAETPMVAKTFKSTEV